MKLYCCDEWDQNIEKIDGPITLQSIRAGRNLYVGEPFRFCPWCGEKLKQSTIEKVR